MIRRVSDYDSLQPESLEKIEKIVNAKKEKLIHIASTQKEANDTRNKLNNSGFLVKIEQKNDNYLIYATEKEKIKLSDALQNNSFTKIAWGRYIESAFGMIPHSSYDDGTIWHVITGEDGQEYLVKEMDEEENVKRIKKVANQENVLDVKTKKEYKTILNVLYNNNYEQLMDELIDWVISGDNIKDKINEKILTFLNKENITKESEKEFINLIFKTADNNIIKNQNDIKKIAYKFLNKKSSSL